MRACFGVDANPTTSASTKRCPTSTECESRLIALWDEVFAPHRWSTHRAALPVPRASPFAQAFSADERRGTYHRLVECRLMRMMLSRCESILRLAQQKHVDTTAMKSLQARLQPHKQLLRKRLAKALESAHGYFKSALCTAQTPTCAHCRVPGVVRASVEGKPAKSRPDLPAQVPRPQHTLSACEGCHGVFFCSAECEAQYRSSVLGRYHYKHGCCQFVSSWRKKGWPIAGVVQKTELVLMRGEAWEAEGVVVENERDEVHAQFLEVQTAWERVYTTGPAGTWREKWNRGMAVGVTRDAGATTDLYSPMMQACRRGLSALVGAVLDGAPFVHWVVNHVEPAAGATPLFAACDQGCLTVVRQLLQKAQGTIDVNKAQTGDGATPLFVACSNGHVGVVRQLLAYPGINAKLPWTAPSGRQYTPLSKATEKGYTDIIDLLRAHT